MTTGQPDLPGLLSSLAAAVEAVPDDVPLRLHLARLLLQVGRAADALTHVSRVVSSTSSDPTALALLAEITAALSGPEPMGRVASPQGFDWHAAEDQLSDVSSPPPFVESAGEEESPDVERPSVTLADVAGLGSVKERIELAFLTPMRSPQLRRMYGASMRGALLLYGPPGCGKTFLARALAGELQARFYAVSLADVLDMWIGASERNLREVFDTARRNAPCVLFLDEVDALGQKRSQLRGNSAMRGTVNQLLTELDSVGATNEGVFVFAATNHPWDVDPALKRPGRLDRSVMVTPPDQAARTAILRLHLRDRPLAGIDVAALAKATQGWSGADLAGMCDAAAQRALADSVRAGSARPIVQSDLRWALSQRGSSLGPWYETARNVAQFANSSGEYDELLAYLKRHKML